MARGHRSGSAVTFLVAAFVVETIAGCGSTTARDMRILGAGGSGGTLTDGGTDRSTGAAGGGVGGSGAGGTATTSDSGMPDDTDGHAGTGGDGPGGTGVDGGDGPGPGGSSDASDATLKDVRDSSDVDAPSDGSGSATACDCPSGASYATNTCTTGSDVDIHLCKDGFHFASVIVTGAGALAFRAHPGQDPNGWGTSVYLQPFIVSQSTDAGTTLEGSSASLETVDANGIVVSAHGSVSANADSAYGTWSWMMTFSYDAGQKVVSTTASTYSITLAGTLGAMNADLNLLKIASNYLHGVPLVGADSGVGDTGDMDHVDVMLSSVLSYGWQPGRDPPGFYPGDLTNQMLVTVVGQHNIVDTAAQGFLPIATAYKPTVIVSVASPDPAPMIFGASYDTSKETDFAADNVGVTPIVLSTSSFQSGDFTLRLSSVALPGDMP